MEDRKSSSFGGSRTIYRYLKYGAGGSRLYRIVAIRRIQPDSLVSPNIRPSPYLCRSAMVHLLCGLYGLGVIMVGAVFSLAAALTYSARFGRDSFYLETLQVYTYVTSLLFLAYLHAHIVYYQRRSACEARRQAKLNAGQGDVTSEHLGGGTAEREGVVNDDKLANKIHLQEELDHGDGGVDVDCAETRSRSTTPVTRPLARFMSRIPGVTFDAKEVNFYLRLGAIGFGIGSMVQDGFQFAQLLQDGRLSFRCLSLYDIIVVSLRVAFTFAQTYFLFKSHRIVVHRQKCAVRFGFVHLAVTNVVVWFTSMVSEIQMTHLVGNMAATGGSDNSTSRSTPSDDSCPYDETLSWKASLYLFPCAVQYSLIAAAILCQMYFNIGPSSRYSQVGVSSGGTVHFMDDLSPLGDHDEMSTRPPTSTIDREADAGAVDIGPSVISPSSSSSSTSSQVDCDKAHRGLFLGLLVLVFTLVAVSCHFVVVSRGGGQVQVVTGDVTAADYSLWGKDFDATLLSRLIFFFAELILLILSCSAVVLGCAKFRRLKFASVDRDTLLSYLLLTALAGVVLLECFHLLSSISAIRGRGDDDVTGDRTVTALLSVCTSSVILFQVFLQTVFVLDALRRGVQSHSQQRRKPGRTLVTFLLLSNVSLFVLALFEGRKTDNTQIHSAFYGPLGWNIVTHATVPLAIFYRFHSGVCLADIWINAYKLRDK